MTRCSSSSDKTISAGDEERMYRLEMGFGFTLDHLSGGSLTGVQPAGLHTTVRSWSYLPAGRHAGSLARMCDLSKASRILRATNLFAPVAITRIKWQFQPLGSCLTAGALVSAVATCSGWPLYRTGHLHGRPRVSASLGFAVLSPPRQRAEGHRLWRPLVLKTFHSRLARDSNCFVMYGTGR